MAYTPLPVSTAFLIVSIVEVDSKVLYFLVDAFFKIALELNGGFSEDGAVLT